MTFPNPSVATVRICRITRRIAVRRGSGGTCLKTSAPGGRNVTAGDGNMVTADHMGHPRQARNGAMNTSDAGSHDKVQEERPS